MDGTDSNEQKYRRIRRVKRLLRPLPRRSNVHRYPILKLFAGAAKKRLYLWSFRIVNVVPAIYAGAILTFLPLYGIQLPLALLLAVLCKANLPIIVALQMFSNPLTVLPIWFTCYQIGQLFLGVIGIHVRSMNRGEVQSILDRVSEGNWGERLESLAAVFSVTSLGGLILGTIFGLIGSAVYKFVARRTASGYGRIRDRLQSPPNK